MPPRDAETPNFGLEEHLAPMLASKEFDRE
jgi:hypothetical protein